MPKYVSAYVDPWGKERFKFRKTGCRPCYLPPIGSAEFPEAYEEALANTLVGAGRARPKSVSDLLARWYASGTFQKRGAVGQSKIRAILEPFREAYGDKLVASFDWEVIDALVAARTVKRVDSNTGRSVGGTAAANNFRKELGRAFEFAVKLKWIASNPVAHVDRVDHTVEGFHCWTNEELDQYRGFHEVGTHARAALEIMLWTAQRGGDAHRFGPQHMNGDRIQFTPSKTKKKGTVQFFQAAPALLEAVQALPTTGTTAFLLTSFGKPFASAKAFQNKFREWCDDAGLRHCTAHGVRKAIARLVAENGGTQQEVRAMGGWSSDKAAAPYVAAADKAKLAKNAIDKVVQFERDRAAHLSKMVG